MAVTGPDFVSLQVRDLERSAAFYERYLGLKRSDAGPPHAVVFSTQPIAFAVRDVVAGTGLDAVAQPGQRPSTGRSAALSRSPTPTATR
jgi:catechol 2,3-dioxygenase-like lactoylglutathione lyase family enzyme